MKNNLVLIDSTISYNEIKELDKTSDFITFDNESHLMLATHKIEHVKSESFIRKDEFDLIQNKTYDFSNWYKHEDLIDTLAYKNVNLGSLFYIEFWMFLIPVLKKFFEIIKISNNINEQKIFSSPIIYEMAKCLDLHFTKIGNPEKNIGYYYDNFKFENNSLSLKLSSKNFNKLKNMSEKIFSPFVKENKITKNKRVLFIEFNTKTIPKLLDEFKTSNIDTISYCRRRPTVWDIESLNIVKKSNCIIPTYSNLMNNTIEKTISQILKNTQNSIYDIFENNKIFFNIFEINHFSLWKFIKSYLYTLFQKRLETLLLEIELANEMLEQTKPNYVLIQSESGNTEQIVLSLCKKLNIPVILLQHGFLKHSYGGFKLNKFTKSIMNDSDQFIVWGNFMYQHAQKFGMDMKKIFPLGSFTHDNLFLQNTSTKNTKQHLLLLTEGPIWDDIREYTVEELEKYRNSLIQIFNTSKNLEKKLIVKLHPYENDHNEEKIARNIDKSISVVKKKNLKSLLINSDIVISLGTSISTAILDAIILGKPVIRLKFGEWYGDYGDGCCLNVEKDEFEEILNKIINENKFRQELILKQNEFLNEYMSNQGNATKNIVLHINNLL